MKYSKKNLKFAKRVFEASLENGQLNDHKLLSLVTKIKKIRARRTSSLLQALLKEVLNYYKKQTLTVESALDLHPKYLEEIKNIFQKRAGKNLNLEFRRNEALLAGTKITLGDTVWDYSANHTLESFKEAIRG